MAARGRLQRAAAIAAPHRTAPGVIGRPQAHRQAHTDQGCLLSPRCRQRAIRPPGVGGRRVHFAAPSPPLARGAPRRLKTRAIIGCGGPLKGPSAPPAVAPAAPQRVSPAAAANAAGGGSRPVCQSRQAVRGGTKGGSPAALQAMRRRRACGGLHAAVPRTAPDRITPLLCSPMPPLGAPAPQAPGNAGARRQGQLRDVTELGRQSAVCVRLQVPQERGK